MLLFRNRLLDSAGNGFYLGNGFFLLSQGVLFQGIGRPRRRQFSLGNRFSLGGRGPGRTDDCPVFALQG